MDNHKKLFIDIDKFEEDNMSYVKPVLFYKVVRNMGIYYKNESDKKTKIIVQSPKMVVPFGVKEFENKDKKSYQLSLSFTTMTNLYNEEEIKKFYQFINKVDTVNEDTIMDYRKRWGLPKDIKYKKTLQRLSKDFPHYMTVNLPHDEKLGFLFNTYNENAEKSDVSIIDKKSIVSTVLELTDLKFTDKYFRSNWNVLQIRKFKPYSPIQNFFLTACFICDEDDPEDTAYSKLIEQYQKKLQTPLALPRLPLINPDIGYPNCPPPPPPPGTKKPEPVGPVFKPPSLQELLDAKSLLKKTEPIVKGGINGKIVDNPDENAEEEIPIEKPEKKKRRKKSKS